MKKRDEIGSPASTLNRAAPDEPLFILRANDNNAPGVVALWAGLYWQNKTRGNDMPTPEQQAKFSEAMRIASEMIDWKNAHPDKE